MGGAGQELRSLLPFRPMKSGLRASGAGRPLPRCGSPGSAPAASSSKMAQATLLPKQLDLSATERARAMLAERRVSVSPHILEFLSLPSLADLEEDYRSRISEDLKIGYAISDCATQTDGSEITDLKEFTVTTNSLIEFTNSLYDEFTRYKNFLKTQYEDKIREHAFNLWEKINDRLEAVEKLYKQKERKTRHSYQQQLCDALAILRINYAMHYPLGRSVSGEVGDSLAARFERLRENLEEKEVIIVGLEAEIAGYKARESKKFLPEEESAFEKELLQQDNREMQEHIAALTKKLTRIQEAMKQKEKERVELDTEIKQLLDKRRRDLKTMEKLMNNQELLKLEIEREQQRVLSKARELREAQDALGRLTASMEKAEAAAEAAAKRDKKTAKELRDPAAREAAAREAAARADAARQAAEKEAAAREAADLYLLVPGDKEAARKALLAEVARLKKSEREAKLLTERLELELRRVNQAWDLKFQILKKSLHAIKNEMFLRQSLRHSSRFRRPSLGDRATRPLYIQHSMQKKGASSLYMEIPPLPKINSQEAAEVNEEESDVTKIPVTVEIPSVNEGASESDEQMEESSPQASPLPPEH